MKIATETNCYFAKATWPVGLNWKSEWLTQDAAILKAIWFVREWAANGVQAKAAVFYRTGQMECEIDK